MEVCSSEDSIKSQQFSSKAVEKRGGGDLEEDFDSSRKRVKLRDLDSVIRSDGMTNRCLGSLKTNAKAHIGTVEKEVLHSAKECLNPYPGSLDEESLCKKPSALEADHPAYVSLDLNSEVCIGTSACKETVAETNDLTQNRSNAKCEAANDNNNIKAVGCRGLDLNEDASSTVSLVHFDPFFKTHSGMKPKDAWQCGSSTGPLENMSMKKWAEMKQNGFITPNYGSIQATPKHRGRKSKAEVLKRKMEQAKKEQVDRFAKIAAPSGLLNGLNPGIINHVRNSKHVHSIIQALVNEKGEKDRDQENSNSWIHQSRNPHDNASHNIVSISRYAPLHQIPKHAHVLPCEEHKVECQDLCNVEGRLYGYCNDDPLALKLSSSTMMVSENASSLATEEPINAESVDSLSVKAANIASQWLQLLCQDIKGRLVALKRSKRRVQDVITTELPCLLSKEILSKQGNNFAKKATADLHRTRWMMLFNQMEQGLSKEEEQLESQLNQVTKMLAHCEKGLIYLQPSKAIGGLPLPGATEKGCRSDSEDPDGELAVKAAAASIYSTCSFALSMANVKCR